MEALERRYCYFCMCSKFLCDTCQFCTCTAVNLLFLCSKAFDNYYRKYFEFGDSKEVNFFKGVHSMSQCGMKTFLCKKINFQTFGVFIVYMYMLLHINSRNKPCAATYSTLTSEKNLLLQEHNRGD